MAMPFGDTYWAPAGGVIAVDRSAFFSPESVIGSIDTATNVWTPGRGTDGRVTQVSWGLLPTDGNWVEVAGSAFVSNVQPLLTAALPDYNDPGASDLADVLDDYNGFAHDEQGGRIFAHGGGHQGSANNGLYRMDLSKLSWSIAKLPDMQTHWPANYKTNPPRDNSYTIYTNAKDYCVANPATTDVYEDEFFDPVEPLASTRNPTARHTYQAMTFYGGKLRHGVRRYWEWDEASGIWTSRYPFGRNFTTHKLSGGGYTGEAVNGTWDEVNTRYICTPSFIGTPGAGWSYNANDASWSQPSGLVGGYAAYSSVFARRGREWCSFARPNTARDYWPPTLRKWHLDSGAVTNLRLTGIVQSKCLSSSVFDESSTMAYVSSKDRFFVLMPYDLNDAYGATNIPLEPFWIDPAAASITHESQSGAWPTGLMSSSVIKSKLFYSGIMKALVLVSDAKANVRIRRIE